MYRINVYERNKDNKITLVEHSAGRYEYRKHAKAAVLDEMIQSLNLLVDVSHKAKLYTNTFTLHQHASEEGKVYDGLIRFWNIPAGIEGQAHTMYEIEWVDESPVDKYNKMLKDTYGDELTLWIRIGTDEEEDEYGEWVEVEKYYFEGARCPESQLYTTPEEAYKWASEYMHNIDLYVD